MNVDASKVNAFTKSMAPPRRPPDDVILSLTAATIICRDFLPHTGLSGFIQYTYTVVIVFYST